MGFDLCCFAMAEYPKSSAASSHKRLDTVGEPISILRPVFGVRQQYMVVFEITSKRASSQACWLLPRCYLKALQLTTSTSPLARVEVI
jgi:hypothetical protein